MGKNMAIQNQRVKYADSIVSGEQVITGSTIKELIDKKDYFEIELTNEEWSTLQKGTNIDLADRFSTEILNKNLIIIHNNNADSNVDSKAYLIRQSYVNDYGEYMVNYVSLPQYGKNVIGNIYVAYIDYTPGEEGEEDDINFGLNYLNEYKPTKYEPCLYEHILTVKHNSANIPNFEIRFLSSHAVEVNNFEKIKEATDGLVILTSLSFESSAGVYGTRVIPSAFGAIGDRINMYYLDPNMTSGVVYKQIDKTAITSINGGYIRRPMASYIPS